MGYIKAESIDQQLLFLESINNYITAFLSKELRDVYNIIIYWFSISL